MLRYEKLLKFATKAEKQIDAFDSEIFEDFIEEIIVFSQEEIGFKMKCGLNLRERLVNDEPYTFWIYHSKRYGCN